MEYDKMFNIFEKIGDWLESKVVSDAQREDSGGPGLSTEKGTYIDYRTYEERMAKPLEEVVREMEAENVHGEEDVSDDIKDLMHKWLPAKSHTVRNIVEEIS